MSKTIVKAETKGLAAVAKRIDETATQAMSLFEQAGSFEQELAVAQAMSDLRLMLSPEVMQPIMALMNTNLGFKTDRDPNQINKKTGQPNQPYPMEVVRECFIESKLRGFHAVGNEWNIIAGGFYACRNGLKRKCEKWAGVTDAKLSLGVPKNLNGGAIVPCELTWKKDGVPDSIKAEIPVKVNDFMGSDGILGKAERKMWKRMHDRLSGTSTPDGEIGEEAIPTTATVTPQTQTFTPGTATKEEAVASKGVPVKKEEPKEKEEKQEPENVVQMTPVDAASLEWDDAVEPHVNIERLVLAAGHNFDTFQRWAGATGFIHGADALTGFQDLNKGMCFRLFNARVGLCRGLAEHKR